MDASPKASHIALHLGSDLTERAVALILCGAGFVVELNEDLHPPMVLPISTVENSRLT